MAKVLTRPTPARQDAPRGQGRSERSGEAYASRVEPLSDARTMLGERRVLARRGWAGEKSDFSSILLRAEAETKQQGYAGLVMFS